MISSHRIFKTTENEYILHKIHEKLTPDICKALHFLWGFDQTGKFPGYSEKSFWVVFVTVTNKGVNQSGFFSSRYKIIKAFCHTVILQTQDSSKYPRFGNFEMSYVFWICRNYQQTAKHFDKNFFEHIKLLSSENHLTFLRNSCQIRNITVVNGIVTSHCTKLLPPQSQHLTVCTCNASCFSQMEMSQEWFKLQWIVLVWWLSEWWKRRISWSCGSRYWRELWMLNCYYE